MTKEEDKKLQKEKENLNKKIKGRRCPEGWREFEFSCYYITNENKTWMQSTEECQEFGADLVIINITEWTWKWVDGQPNGNNGTDQDCGEFVYHPTSQGWWNDEKCCNKQNWICGEIG
uniref:C-type lectin domain-containing protein n=1 Tax=Oncorhynchus kisutch TaxID=8019 RepID=A0A8C7KZH8_ONCKI